MKLIALITYLFVQAQVTDWKQYKSLPELDVMYKTEEVHDQANDIHQEYIVLKFINKSNDKLLITWNTERYQGAKCTTCGNDEYKYSLVLEPMQSIEGANATSAQKLKIFVKHLNLPNNNPFTKFELGGLKVSKL